MWLLSSNFDSLRNDSFIELVDKTYDGIVFFLSFGNKDATDIEKSLGKMVMSLIALVCGVAASYRTLKRGAVKLSNTLFIYFSLTCQVSVLYSFYCINSIEVNSCISDLCPYFLFGHIFLYRKKLLTNCANFTPHTFHHCISAQMDFRTCSTYPRQNGFIGGRSQCFRK